MLAPGAAVTSTRAHVRYVVTEYGVAELHGRDLAERARLLISIAAPEFREELTVAARALHLLSGADIATYNFARTLPRQEDASECCLCSPVRMSGAWWIS